MMNNRGTLRYNPSCTHISTTKFNKKIANKKIKAILTMKVGIFNGGRWRKTSSNRKQEEILLP